MKVVFAAFLIGFSSLVLADDFDEFSEYEESSEESKPSEDIDPWVNINRPIFEFNEAIDRAVLRPIAVAYNTYTPKPLDIGITNFFRNWGEPMVVANDILQLKIRQAASDSARFAVNTTLGLLGLFDVATQIGLPRHEEDFGQTLGYWGVESGPYLMLPFLGPSSVRDGFGRAVEMTSVYYVPELTPLYAILNPEHRIAYYSLFALNMIDLRASFLVAEGLVTGDRYIFFRSAYLQRREYLVNDGQQTDDLFAEDAEFDDDEAVDKESSSSDDESEMDDFDRFPEFE